MPTELDALQLGVSASTSSAERSIDGLINALGRLNNALTMPNFSSYTASLSDFGNELMNLEFAAKSIDSNGIKDMASSINSLTGAGAKLNSLGEAFGQMGDGGNIQKVVQNLNLLQDVHIPDMTNLINVKNSLGKLGGKDAERAISNLPRIAEGIRSLQGIYVPQLDGLTAMADSLAKFGNANNTRTAQNLSVIADGLRRFEHISVPNSENIASLARSLAQFGYSSAQKAVQTIPQLAIAFRSLITTLSGAPRVSQNVIDLANSMANLASAGGRAGTAVNTMTPRLNNFSRSCGRAAKSGKSLAQIIGKVYATYWLLFRAFGKLGEAIDYSSQLTEVQNVVDTVFGDEMKDKVENLASTSITALGMSELSAKQFASRFQAMGAAMGITADQVVSANDKIRDSIKEFDRSYKNLGTSMADVSVNLTKLAADMGSFYNMDYAEVADDLASIFTGMTRPLRRYGLDLTEATLKEFAMTNGLNSNIKAMTQAEKTMLRYQYVMANMGHVMGDFNKTMNTWANVVRTIGQQFQKLGSLIGQGFINLLKPTLIRFRDFMNTLIGLVEKGLNAIGKLLGWQIDIQEVGMTMDDGMEDFADATGKAAGKAKKLKDYLLGIDELNVLNPDDGSGGGGDGDATGGGGGASSVKGGGYDMKRYNSDIASWFDLGRTIADKLADALKNIDWDSIYEKAKNFGKNFAEFLNGLITPDLFYQVGRTIANALNTAIYAAVSFADTAKWKQFGRAIAAGINGFFENFDFKELAHAINLWVKGILDMMIEAVDKVKWDQIGRKIGEFLAEIDFMEIFSKVAKLMWKALNGAIDAYSAMFKTAPMETALLSLIGLTRMLRVAPLTDFGKAMGNLSHQTELFALAMRGGSTPLQALGLVMPRLGRGMDAVRSSMLAFDNSMMAGLSTTQSLNAGLSTLSASISPLVQGIAVLGTGILDFALAKDAFYDMTMGINDANQGISDLIANIAEFAAGVAAAGVAMTVVFGFPAGIIAAGVIGLTGAMVGLYQASGELAEQHALATITNDVNGLSYSLDDMTEALRNNVASIIGNLDELKNHMDLFTDSKESIESLTQSLDALTGGLAYQGNVTAEEIDSIVGKISELDSVWKQSIQAKYDYAIEAAAADLAYLEQTGQATDEIREQYNTRIAALLDEKNAAIEAADEKMQAFRDASDAYYEVVNNENATDAERQAAVEGYTSALTSYYGEQREAVGTLAGEVETSNEKIMTSLSDLAGQLNLSGLAVDDYDGIMSALGDNLQTAGDVISGAEQEIQDQIGSTTEMLKTATGEEKVVLEERLATLNQQNEDLKGVSSEYARILQEEYMDKGKQIIENSLAEYEAMSPGERTALAMTHGINSGEAYAKMQFQQFADNTILNEGGLADSINKNLDVAEGEIWVDDFAQNVTDGIFETTFKASGDREVELADNWTSVFNNALGTTAENIKPAAGEVGKNVGYGVTEGMAEVDPSNPIAVFFDNLFTGICEKFEIDSPAETMKPVGENIVLGILEGFNLVDFMGEIQAWWDTNVAPWFTLEKWYELGHGIYDGIKMVWDEFIVTWGEDILIWWEESVMPWFSIEKWEETAQGIKDGIKNKWDETSKQWVTDIQAWWNTNVMPWFTLQKWTDLLKNIAPAFKSAFKGAANNAIDSLNGVIAGVESMVNRAIEALNALIGGAGELLAAAGISVSVSLSPVSLPRIPHFAKGGFVPATSYSLFAAGENGIPEMIGTVGGRTAVAGGEEITGIRSAIEASSEREAYLMERLIEVEEALIAVVEDKELTIGDEDIAEANIRGQRSMGYQLRMA